jgi:hypothetical protein
MEINQNKNKHRARMANPTNNGSWHFTPECGNVQPSRTTHASIPRVFEKDIKWSHRRTEKSEVSLLPVS